MTEPVDLARATMNRLYSPGGCPWDAEQTHASLVPYLVEECHELVEAIETGTREDVIEELGDVLLQVLFHARLGEEEDRPYDLDTVAAALVEKLRRRHPHVFGDEASGPDAETLVRRWEELKRAEKPDRGSVLDGIPPSLPALARAQKVVRKAGRLGVPGLVPETGTDADLGEALLRLVAAAEARGIDAEAALRARLRETEAGVRAAESTRAPASEATADDPARLPTDT